MNQMVLSKIEEDVLAGSLQKHRDSLNEILEAIGRRDISTTEIKESLKSLEDRIRGLRKNGLLARP